MALALGLLFVFYLALPTKSDTSPPTTCARVDVACVFNVDQGTVAFAAFAVGTLGVVIAAFVWISGSRVERTRQAMFSTLLFEAVYEACHNLYHLAAAYKPVGERSEDKSISRRYELVRWPSLYLAAASRVLEQPYAQYLQQELRSPLDHLLRNDDIVRRYPVTDAPKGQAAKDLGYCVEHILRFLVAAAREREPENREADAVLSALEVPHLNTIIASRRDWYVRLRRSELTADGARPDNEIQFWWFDDIHPQQQASTDYCQWLRLGDPPPRASCPQPPKRRAP